MWMGECVTSLILPHLVLRWFGIRRLFLRFLLWLGLDLVLLCGSGLLLE